MAAEDDLPWPSLEQVYEAARAFLDPVLQTKAGIWMPREWAWS